MNTINSLLCAIKGCPTETNPIIIDEPSGPGSALLILNVEQCFTPGVGNCSRGWEGAGMRTGGDTAVGGTGHREGPAPAEEQTEHEARARENFLPDCCPRS